MTAEERDNWELLNFKMDSEGFDYCFRKYSSGSETEKMRKIDIKDETLHQLIDQYVEMAEKLENYINKKFQEAIDSDYK